MSGIPLPGVLAEIEQIVGRDAAIRLAIRLGGREIHVPGPEKITKHHSIAVVIGIRNAAMLSQRFRGASLYVPHARKALCLHYHSIGWSVRAISELLQISPNGVRKNLYRA